MTLLTGHAAHGPPPDAPRRVAVIHEWLLERAGFGAGDRGDPVALPGLASTLRYAVPLMPPVVEQFDLSGFLFSRG